MPTYNAKCAACGIQEEYLASITRRLEDLPTCAKCEEKMETAYMPACGGIRLNSTTIKGTSPAGTRLIKPMKDKK